MIHADRLGRDDKHGQFIALQVEKAVHARLQLDKRLVWKKLRKLGEEVIRRELSGRFLVHPAVLTTRKAVYFERGFPSES